MFRAEHNSNKGFARSAAFSFFLLFLLILFYGVGAHLFLLAPFVLLLANLFFFSWPNGGALEAISEIAIRSIGFSIVLFILSVFWTKLFPSGQVGYGDRLQIDGSQITPLGYAMLFKWSGMLAFLTFWSAVLAAQFVRKK